MSIKKDPKFEENALAVLKSAFRGVSPDESFETFYTYCRKAHLALVGSQSTTPKNLEVGDSLLVLMDEDSVLTDWEVLEVKSISICHQYRAEGVLEPYICVGVTNPRLMCFNYTMYCETGRVKFYDATKGTDSAGTNT